MNKFQDRIEYHFINGTLLIEALTHKSYANEQHLSYNYERLEYLGDAVLQMIVSDYLIDKYPKYRECELSRGRSAIVSEMALSKKAKEIGLNEYIRLGKGEILTNGRNKPSILADVMEALIGAIYKDNGLEAAEAFVNGFILKDVQIVDTDYKSRLFEHLGDRLRYSLIAEQGKEHAKTFTVEAAVDGVPRATGTGRTKKAAEQEAAKKILLKFNN